MMKLLISKDGKKYFTDRTEIQTDKGLVKTIEEDGIVKTSKGEEFLQCSPNRYDLFEKMKRGPQIITLKDGSYILARMGVDKDTTVIDAGGGSGFLTCFLALHSRKVYSYERRKEFCDIIEKNIKLLGLENVEIKNKNIYNGFREEADAVTLDLLEPWKVPLKNLKIGGMICCYCPTINQVMKIKKKKNVIIEEVSEIMKREWRTDDIERPKSKMIAHTGFLVFMRKIG